jgi:hypothetical protein
VLGLARLAAGTPYEAAKPDSETPGEGYARLARECVDVVNSVSDGDQRYTALQMAQVWQRLADQ